MHCHQIESRTPTDDQPVILVGNPNVGKSAIFAGFTGRRVDVSNYPGTTVELAHGRLKVNGSELPLIGTPGIHSLLPRSDDERVARDVLTAESPWAVIQVADSKNLRRALLLTFQLAEYDLPLVLALNMTDEAEALGITVDSERLSQVLGADAVKTVATRQEGLNDLREPLMAPRLVSYQIRYDGVIETAISKIASRLPAQWPGKRAMALASLAGYSGAFGMAELDQKTLSQVNDHPRRGWLGSMHLEGALLLT
jgi:ferrous iron transport protein B